MDAKPNRWNQTATLSIAATVPTSDAEPYVKLLVFALFLLFGFGIIPLFVKAFLTLQTAIGNGNQPIILSLRRNQIWIILAFWSIMGLGVLVALPFMWTDFFGFKPIVGGSQGTLVANVGMTLDEVKKQSSLKVVEGFRAQLTGTHMSIAEVVFDFEIANTGTRFPRCRYYWLETGNHDDPKLVHLNIGISTTKMTMDELNTYEKKVHQDLKTQGWSAGHFVNRTEKQLQLSGGKPTYGDGRYWAKGDALIIFQRNRVDEEKRGEEPTAGAWILYIDLVPRQSSNYGELVYK